MRLSHIEERDYDKFIKENEKSVKKVKLASNKKEDLKIIEGSAENVMVQQKNSKGCKLYE